MEILTLTIQILLILCILLFGYLGFGLLILKKLQLIFSKGEKLILATVVSISLVTALIALVGQFVSTTAFYLLVPVFLLGATQYKEVMQILYTLYLSIKTNIVGSVILLFLTLIFTTTLIFSGFKPDGSLAFQEIHDSVWHIALVENLLESIPPKHPSTDTILLHNYHYFYDLFLSGFAKITNISHFILYFQLSVLFLSSTLVGSAFILGKKLQDAVSGYILATVTILFGSVSYLIPVFFHPEQPWGESSFWVSQTFVMIVNPQVIYTLTVTYLVLLLIFYLEKIKKLTLQNKKQYFGLHFLIIILSATSIGFKSYAFVILSVLYAVVLLREIIKHKSYLPILIGLLYSVVSLPFMWLITRFASNSFFYEPLWFTNTMIESPDRVNYLEWKFLQDHYLFKKNWPRLWMLEAKKIAIFYIGNLGVRVLFVGLPLLALFKKYRKEINWVFVSYIFIAFLFSSIFPLLFLQKGIVWNSIQFWYYALLFANVLFVFLLIKIFKAHSKKLLLAVFTVLLFASIPTTLRTLQEKTNKPFTLEKEIVQELQQLDDSNIILLCSEGSAVYHSALVKVITPAKVYLANPSQLELVGSDVSIAQEYEEMINKNNAAELQKIISSQNITTILCSDRHLTNKFESMLSSLNINIKSTEIDKWQIIEL